MPFREAIRLLTPNTLWTDYVFAQDRVSRAGDRPRYLEMNAREWQEESATFEARKAGAIARERQAFERVYSAFIERLVAGELTGLVQDEPPFGPWRPIPPLGWRSMEPVDVDRGYFQAGERLLRSVQILDEPYTPAIEISGSGSPGKPTSRHIFMEEHRRRCEAGIARDSVRVEAEHLEAWMREHHPNAPGGKAKTIENNIRDAHRAWTMERQGAVEKSGSKAGTIRP